MKEKFPTFKYYHHKHDEGTRSRDRITGETFQIAGMLKEKEDPHIWQIDGAIEEMPRARYGPWIQKSKLIIRIGKILTARGWRLLTINMLMEKAKKNMYGLARSLENDSVSTVSSLIDLRYQPQTPPLRHGSSSLGALME